MTNTGNIEVHKYMSDLSVSFNIYGKIYIGDKFRRNGLASSELTLISYPLDDFKSDSKNETWYYFNRLIVPVGFDVKQASILLMKETCNWADQNKINIIDELNPYFGRKFTLDNLIIFNRIFRFKMYKKPNTMIRRFYQEEN